MIQPTEKQNKKNITSSKEVSLKDLLGARELVTNMIADLEETLKLQNNELLERLKAEGLTGKVVGNRAITKVRRMTFSTSLEEAKEFGAIKQAVDSDILRKLFEKGVDIPGTRITEYVAVKNIEKKGEDEK